MKRFILLCLFCATLPSCAEYRKSEIHQADEVLLVCSANIYHNPNYDSITPHLPSPENKFQPTMQQLSNDAKPTKSETSLLIKYHDDLMPCRQAFLQKMQTLSSVVAQNASEGWFERDQAFIKLTKRKISWGEYATQSQQIGFNVQKNINADLQSRASLAAQLQSAKAASRQANAAWYQATKPEPVQTPTYLPTTTNCRTIGNTLSCQSY